MAQRGHTGNMQMTPYKFKVWNVAIYIRLSNADKRELGSNKYNDESESVSNQRDIIRDVIDELTAQSNGDQFNIVDEYIDDGVSGTTDEERDDFQRMLGDIEKGNVNCVIVKTLARAFRNYSDQGYFLENYFPRRNVRFICIGNPRIDTYLTPDVVNGIEVPINGLMNDRYSYNTSCDIRRSFDIKRRKGEFIGSFAPYGYDKDPENRHKLVIDSEAAEVVKQVFELYLSGMSKCGIMRHLNDLGIVPPAEYKRQKGINFQNGKQASGMWTQFGVHMILRNRVYIGDMVQGRQKRVSYKIHVLENVPKEDWIIVENTHEAIISEEVYEKAQEILQRTTRTAPKKWQLYLFSGFLKCADCGRAMAKSGNKANVYYRCTAYMQSRQACTSHTIKHRKLEMAVLYAVNQMIQLASSYTYIINEINAIPQKKTETEKLNKAILSKENELANIKRYKQSAYEDWKDNLISRGDYQDMVGDYEVKAEQLRTVISNLVAERTKSEKGVDVENPFLSAFRRYESITTLSRELLLELVDRVKIYEGGDICVVFKHRDELQRVAEYIDINTQNHDNRKAG